MQTSLVGPPEPLNPMEEAVRHMGSRLAAAWRAARKGQLGPDTRAETGRGTGARC